MHKFSAPTPPPAPVGPELALPTPQNAEEWVTSETPLILTLPTSQPCLRSPPAFDQSHQWPYSERGWAPQKLADAVPAGERL